LTTSLSTAVVGWLFAQAGLVIVFFLVYPGIVNLFKLSQSIYNFNLQLKHSHHNSDEEPQHSASSDSQMIWKLYLNFGFDFVNKACQITFSLLLFYISEGFLVGYLPLPFLLL
jgi:hypothetical protein